jgi:hypothetical protein
MILYSAPLILQLNVTIYPLDIVDDGLAVKLLMVGAAPVGTLAGV